MWSPFLAQRVVLNKRLTLLLLQGCSAGNLPINQDNYYFISWVKYQSLTQIELISSLLLLGTVGIFFSSGK